MNVMSPMSAPQMLRSEFGHAGTARITNILPGAVNEPEYESKVKEGSFASYLLNAVNSVNDKQLEVSRVQEQLITDPDSVDIHDVTTAMAKAQMSLSLAQTVIDRLVQGWNELQTTR